MNKRKFLSVIVLSLGLSLGVGVVEARACGDGEYVVSAYYSPLPGQSYYATGTYVGDIRLNGGGVTTASGVKVADAPGAFLASPSCFEFGTIVELEGMGNYVILDRGGAIQGNRLDLWTGYGEEGLTAALNWGKRTVNLKTLGVEADVELAEKAGWNLPTESTFLKEVDTKPLDTLDNLKVGDTGAAVSVLQQLLADLGYFDGEVDGYFGVSTKEALLDMDKDYGEIVSININPQGILGSTSIEQIEQIIVNKRRELEESIPSNNLGLGSSGNDVLNLQRTLRMLGYVIDLTEEFDAQTERALIKFQMDEGVINSSENLSAGYFGESTQEAMKDAVALLLPNEITNEQNGSTEIRYEFLTEAQKFKNNLRLGQTSEEVRALQEMLGRLNLFRLEPTGYFGPVTQHAVIKLQLKYGIINQVSDAGAGEVGPKTRVFLNQFYDKYLARINVGLKSLDEFENRLFEKELRLGDTGNDVFVLQKFLQDQGYLKSVLLTKYYGDQTFSAMSQFKFDNNLINDIDVFSAGNLDADTIDYINAQFD